MHKEVLRAIGYYKPHTGIYVHQQLAVPIGEEVMMVRGFRTAN